MTLKREPHEAFPIPPVEGQRFRYRTRLGMTPEKAEQIRAEYAAGGVSQSQFGRKYGMSQVSVGRIVLGYYWNYKGINW